MLSEYPGPESNRQLSDFKSEASANWATWTLACIVFRTIGYGFEDRTLRLRRCLTGRNT